MNRKIVNGTDKNAQKYSELDISIYGGKTWKDVTFRHVFPQRKTNRIIGLTFPSHDANLGLEPGLLTVLPDGDNVEYHYNPNDSFKDFNDNDVDKYVCSVYISGMEEFEKWAIRHNRDKIVVGGYHPTSFPEEFTRYAKYVIQGPTDDLNATLEAKHGLKVIMDSNLMIGVNTYTRLPRYDLWNPQWNQQIIPDKKPGDIVTSINTSMGCAMRCNFCATPLIAPKMMSKPLELVLKETDYLKTHYRPDWIFIRDENFPLQIDWQERLKAIGNIGAKTYLFASANTITDEKAKILKDNGVYMVCLGLEDVSENYEKNRNGQLDKAVSILKKHGIMSYLSFIVNPLKVVGREAGEAFYDKLMSRLFELKPEMICGNFLMPFPGTKLWDEYYHLVSKEDYKHFDSKTPFLIKNQVVQEKMKFFMFWNQWLYYNSDTYNNDVRKFDIGDTLSLRFKELYSYFKPRYERLWNARA